VLADKYEPNVRKTVSNGSTYIALRFDANGRVIGHGNSGGHADRIT